MEKRVPFVRNRSSQFFQAKLKFVKGVDPTLRYEKDFLQMQVQDKDWFDQKLKPQRADRFPKSKQGDLLNHWLK